MLDKVMGLTDTHLTLMAPTLIFIKVGAFCYIGRNLDRKEVEKTAAESIGNKYLIGHCFYPIK
jgi:hypothetical protein